MNLNELVALNLNEVAQMPRCRLLCFVDADIKDVRPPEDLAIHEKVLAALAWLGEPLLDPCTRLIQAEELRFAENRAVDDDTNVERHAGILDERLFVLARYQCGQTGSAGCVSALLTSCLRGSKGPQKGFVVADVQGSVAHLRQPVMNEVLRGSAVPVGHGPSPEPGSW